MKAIFAALALSAGLCACAYPDPQAPDAGNPNHTAYAGAPGSAYNAAANPPRDEGAVTYNPEAPMAPPPEPAPLVTAQPLPAAH